MGAWGGGVAARWFRHSNGWKTIMIVYDRLKGLGNLLLLFY